MLFFNGEVWVKKGDTAFDVTMGCPDGAEVAELVGLYLLHRLDEEGVLDPEGTGLYRDDGIAFVHSRGRSGEKLRQNVHNFFREEGFKIEISPVRDFVDFLDCRLHVEGEHEVYHKENNQSVNYVHTKSNHPPTILNQISKNTEARVSKLCSNEKMFNKHREHYKSILSKSGHPSDLKYLETISPQNKSKRSKRRKRHIIWYNPPWNLQVRTNLGREFFRLLDSHFPKGFELSHIYNRNTIKLSYCTMSNVKAIIKSHNERKKEKVRAVKEKLSEKKTCNCQKSRVCPVEGKCLISDVVYEAKVIQTSGAQIGSEHSYIGLTSQTFKARFSKHKATLKNPNSKEHTALSEFVHKLKDRGVDYKIQWRLVEQAKSFDGLRCNLCLSEKAHILFNPAPNPLNKRSELLFKCRHQGKYSFSKEPGGAHQSRADVDEIKITTTTNTETQATQEKTQRARESSKMSQ